MARFFTGDLDLACYSNNWDLNRRYLPRRSCAYCACAWNSLPFIEDEWHVLLICPLYQSARNKLPLTASRLRVEGHELQGAGVTQRNLQSLMAAMLQVSNPNLVAEFLAVAMAQRRRHRASL